jgi:hypothetical protein
MKRKGSTRYDNTADKRYRVGDLTTRTLGGQTIDEGGDKILASLGAPFSSKGAGARVPDLNLQASTTGTFMLEITQTANAGQCTGGILNLCSGAITYCEETSSSTDSIIRYCSGGNYGGTGGSPNTQGQVEVTNPVWERTTTSGGAAGDQFNKLLPNFSTVYGQVSGLRITGAAIQCEFTGNDQNNQGLITSYSTSWSDIEQGKGFSGVANDVSAPFLMLSSQSYAENFRTQFNGAAKNGVNLSWLPADNGDLEYGTVPRVTGGGTDSILAPISGAFLPVGATCTARQWGYAYSTRSTSLACGETDRSVRNYGALAWHASGLATTASFRVTVIVHTEMLPINDIPSLGIDMAIARPLNSVMSLISALATGDTTGTVAETTAVTDARAGSYIAAAQAAKKATNDDSIGSIGSLMSTINMTPSTELLAAVAAQFYSFGKGMKNFAEFAAQVYSGGLLKY